MSLAGFGLRRAVAGDRDALVALQEAAYAPNRVIIGRTPIPLEWDYDAVIAAGEVWLAEDDGGLAGALILAAHSDHLYIENISVAPRLKGRGLGNRLLAAAEARARALGLPILRLLTNERLVANTAWYGRRGFAVEFVEDLGDRRVTHMIRRLDDADADANRNDRPGAERPGDGRIET